MDIIKNSIAVLGLIIVTTQSQATLITNGSFGVTGGCNTGDWTKFGDVRTVDISGICSAELNVNDFADYEAELSQNLILDVNTDYILSVDFNVGTSFVDTVFDDFFSISLINEDFDILELLSMNIIGNETLSKSLAIDATDLTSFTNQNWALSFYLFDDVDLDDNNSFTSISNVFIEEVVTDVPEPSTLAIFILGFASLISRKKIANKLIRKSIKK
jgi:hypothetical protein